jgi:hypothetical protein
MQPSPYRGYLSFSHFECTYRVSSIKTKPWQNHSNNLISHTKATGIARSSSAPPPQQFAVSAPLMLVCSTSLCPLCVRHSGQLHPSPQRHVPETLLQSGSENCCNRNEDGDNVDVSSGESAVSTTSMIRPCGVSGESGWCGEVWSGRKDGPENSEILVSYMGIWG